MYALITGASSGIGRHLALLFAQHGYDLALVARREAALQELADEIAHSGRTARVVAADLGTADGAQQVYDRVFGERLEIDVLVNSAGKRLVIPGCRNKLGPLVIRLSPRSMVPGVVKRLNEIE